jgi:uncharacterized protein (DUF362 family)
MTVLLSDGRTNIKEVLHNILDTFHADIDGSRGVFLKPNIVFAVKPKSREITSPSFVKLLVTVLREHYSNIDIIVGEGVAAGCDPAENFRVSGYSALAHELNIPLLDLDRVERETIPWKFGKVKIPKVALERTYINLPILKPSSACVISGALKNQKGLLLPVIKKQFHHLGLHEQIAELYAVVQPKLTIMDCSNFFGRNTLISGNNCGEVDATACKMLGIEEPEHVQNARSVRLFVTGFTVLGDKFEKKNPSARPKLKEFKRIGRLRLWSNPQACTGCRYLFRDIKHNFLQRQSLLSGAKLIAYSIKGAEMIMGENPQWRKEYPNVICIGACTAKVAKEGGYIHVPGCPPTLRDLNDHLP